jgi:hypothetical protein
MMLSEIVTASTIFQSSNLDISRSYKIKNWTADDDDDDGRDVVQPIIQSKSRIMIRQSRKILDLGGGVSCIVVSIS